MLGCVHINVHMSMHMCVHIIAHMCVHIKVHMGVHMSVHILFVKRMCAGVWAMCAGAYASVHVGRLIEYVPTRMRMCPCACVCGHAYAHLCRLVRVGSCVGVRGGIHVDP
jgi:hypothetical protein